MWRRRAFGKLYLPVYKRTFGFGALDILCTRLSWVTTHWYSGNGPLTRYVKLRVVHAPGMPGSFSSPPWVSDPDMHHGTCVTHVTWCMPVSLTSVFLLKSVAGKTFPAFPAHAQPTISRIWQEAHHMTVPGVKKLPWTRRIKSTSTQPLLHTTNNQ